MKSLQGKLLIASPQLTDPNFARAVVLMLQHTKEGAFGVVLNRPINKTVKELWAEVEEPPCDSQQHLNLGGPVSGPLMALHDAEKLGEVEIVSGVYFSHEKENLEKLVQVEGARFKLFVGHSGWGDGQLENEIKQGAWFTLPATADHIFGAEDQLWSTVTQQIGGRFFREVLKIKHVPAEPGLN